MVYLVGTDEAGYGPNLGPLCIAASAWEVPDEAANRCLYKQLSEAVCRQAQAGDERLAIADSKRLYKSGASLALLERGVLAALACVDRLPTRWRDVWRALDKDALAQIDSCPWHEGFDEAVPGALSPEDLQAVRECLAAMLTKAFVRLLDLQATTLFAAAFNQDVKRCGNKAEVLSLATLRLAGRMLERLPQGRAIVLCDKHGGRNHYAALLQHVFPEELVLVRVEEAELGLYEVRHQGRQIEFRFQPKGEKHLPTALASMTAKYLRELAMRPFNAFWQRQVEGLRPTAGYAGDAGRFFEEIREARQKLKIAEEVMWRVK